MAYNFGIMDLQIHTFSGVMNTNGRIDLFNEKCNMNSSTDIGSVNEITNTSDELFRVGYTKVITGGFDENKTQIYYDFNFGSHNNIGCYCLQMLFLLSRYTN